MHKLNRDWYLETIANVDTFDEIKYRFCRPAKGWKLGEWSVPRALCETAEQRAGCVYVHCDVPPGCRETALGILGVMANKRSI